jgi:hypothetical protein
MAIRGVMATALDMAVEIHPEATRVRRRCRICWRRIEIRVVLRADREDLVLEGLVDGMDQAVQGLREQEVRDQEGTAPLPPAVVLLEDQEGQEGHPVSARISAIEIVTGRAGPPSRPSASAADIRGPLARAQLVGACRPLGRPRAVQMRIVPVQRG